MEPNGSLIKILKLTEIRQEVWLALTAIGVYTLPIITLYVFEIHQEVWLALTAIGAYTLPFITIIGFWFVNKQLKREREALETQTREQVYQGSLGILKMFVEHPDLRPYFYDSIPMPVQVPDRSKVLAACEVMGDHWENILLSKKSLDEETLGVWKEYMKGVYETSPSLRYFLLHEGYRYSGNFLVLFDRSLPDTSKQQRTIDLSQRAGLSA